MISGIGVDIVNLSRIKKIVEKRRERFLKKVFCDDEIVKNNIYEIGGKFSAKEAFVKALGTGFTKNVFFKDIKVLNEPSGKPFIEVSDKMKKAFSLYDYKIHLSISHDGEYAVAMVVLEKI